MASLSLSSKNDILLPIPFDAVPLVEWTISSTVVMSLFTPLSINNVDLPVLSIVYAFGALIEPIVPLSGILRLFANVIIPSLLNEIAFGLFSVPIIPPIVPQVDPAPVHVEEVV